jgi:hypothetical protein
LNAPVISVCRNPQRACWRLDRAPSAYGHVGLIGWTLSLPPVDAGVPIGIAEILARAMTAVARITFPISELEDTPEYLCADRDEYVVKTLQPQPHKLLHWMVPFPPTTINVISTRNADCVVRAFDDAGYPWWLQQQVVLFSTPNAGPPEISLDGILRLIGGRWESDASWLSRTLEITAVGRPGVDGDVIGIYTRSDEELMAFLRALQSEAKASSAGFRLLSEEDFLANL